MPYSQEMRIGDLTTPLGADKLVLVSFEGSEAMSGLFEFTLEALCEQEATENLDFDAALGRTCTVRVPTQTQGDRHFAGTLAEAERVGPLYGGVLYRLTLRPWFWMLSHRINSRIFHEKAVDEIIDAIMADHGGYADLQNKTGQSYEQMEYCVQHRESDMAFVSRLMEQHGIGYHFEYADDKQTMVLSAGRSGYKDVPGKTRNFYISPERTPKRREYLRQWMGQRRFTTGKVTYNDYNFKEPGANLVVEKPGGAGYQPGELEHYGHPGGYDKPPKGQPLVTAAIDAYQATDGHYLAAGTCLGFSPGHLFDLGNHHDAGEYLVLRAHHKIAAEAYRSVGSEGEETYAGRYEVMKADRQYAPPLVTPKPYIAGPQTAVVVGDEELETDKWGRVKVHFHWNRANQGEREHESMWCRVAQVWAGATWGGQFLPRRDMEVLVHFIDGDPDRPIIVGSVYNEKNMPPYELASDKDTSGWKTKDLEGDGYNELAFVDRPGKELIRIYGERDLTATLRNDVLIEAEHQITLRVGGSEIVMDTRSITIKSDSIKVEATMDLKTNGKATANHEAGGPMIIKAAIVKIN